MAIQYRFYTPQDAAQTNRLAHAVFAEIAPFPPEVWQQMEENHHVTVLAEEDGCVVGAIPFDLRDFLIRPGVSVRAAFAHMVGVDARGRSKGVGSGMMSFARANLPSICDGMFVYTGNEGVPPYTFYEKNGFIDLHYCRFFSLESPAADFPPGINLQSFDPARVGEEALDRCYQDAYAGFAGFPVHAPGYWRESLASIIYAEIPTEFHIAFQKKEGELLGYAILGCEGEACTVLELAARPNQPGLIRDLLTAALAHASSRGLKRVQMLASACHPALPVLYQLGFQPDPRAEASVTAAVIFQFETIWQKLTCGQPPFSLEIWTPTRRLELPGSGRRVRLEMKDGLLQRLFLCRERFSSLFDSEQITSPDETVPREALDTLFAPAPWVFHWFEWI